MQDFAPRRMLDSRPQNEEDVDNRELFLRQPKGHVGRSQRDLKESVGRSY